jgi:DNA end-binding protein Ku
VKRIPQSKRSNIASGNFTERLFKGYEYDRDHFVVVTNEEIEKIKTEKEKSIQILHFAQLNQISPVYL